MPPDPRSTCFATCAPGLEPVLHGELRELVFAKLERQVGGVRFEGDRRDVWRANLRLRSATRVLERIARFPAADGDALHAACLALPWERWLRPDGALWVSAHTNESALDHSRFVEQRVKDAVCDRFRDRGLQRPRVEREEPDLRIDLHLFRDRATVSLDTSGEPLHKRGWRRHQGRAPLAETLAAGCALLSTWDRRSPLVDPFCGSGTLLIEAALLARDVPPGAFGRTYAFERLPDHDARAYARLKARELAPRPTRKLRLFGYDADPARVREATENVAAAGLSDAITIEQRAFSDLELRRGWNAWILTNPPYGERVGEGTDLAPLYTELGRRLREEWAGYHLELLSGDPRWTKALALKVHRRVALRNGGLPVQLVHCDPFD